MADELDLRELERMIDRGDHFRLIEVEDAAEFARGHLPGAVHLPPDRVRRSTGLPPDREERIVLYCRGDECADGAEVAEILRDMGYRRVVRLAGGKRGWIDAGHPLETD